MAAYGERPELMSDGRVRAAIRGIATHLPEYVLTNEELAQTIGTWSADKIFEKTGIRERRIAAADETAGDLALAAARRLFDRAPGTADEVDFLLFCSQAPDYYLPTTACVLQDKLGLAKSIGALDFNLGCSGYVYGLSLAAGLIGTGSARNVLLLTADTYSKYIHPRDGSVRTLFGDGAAATLISADPVSEQSEIGPFVFGTDGSGSADLIVQAGGFRLRSSSATAVEAADSSGNVRSADNLHMRGAAVLNFTLREVPAAMQSLLARSGTDMTDYDGFVFHQANKFMLDALQRKAGVPPEKLPRYFEAIGNTVSSTIPFVLEQEIAEGRYSSGARLMLVGFGVGLSWAAARVVL